MVKRISASIAAGWLFFVPGTNLLAIEETWTWRAPTLQGNDLVSAASSTASPSTVVAVGEAGTFVAKQGTGPWQTGKIEPTGTEMGFVGWLGNQFVAIGADSGDKPWLSKCAFFKSSDGANWNRIQISPAVDLEELGPPVAVAAMGSNLMLIKWDGSYSVASTNGGDTFAPGKSLPAPNKNSQGWGLYQALAGKLPSTWVAVGDAGTVATSTNGGATWSKKTIAGTAPIEFVEVWSDGSSFLAEGYDGSGWNNFVVYRSDDGLSWALVSGAEGSLRPGMGAVPGRYISKGESPDGHDVLFTSTDGAKTWQRMTLESLSSESFPFWQIHMNSALSAGSGGTLHFFGDAGLVVSVVPQASASFAWNLESKPYFGHAWFSPFYSAAGKSDGTYLAVDGESGYSLLLPGGMNEVQLSRSVNSSDGAQAVTVRGNEFLGARIGSVYHANSGQSATNLFLKASSDGVQWSDLSGVAPLAITSALTNATVSVAALAANSATPPRVVVMTLEESWANGSADAALRLHAWNGSQWTNVPAAGLGFIDKDPGKSVPPRVEWDGERFLLLTPSGSLLRSLDGVFWEALPSLPSDSQAYLDDKYAFQSFVPSGNRIFSFASKGDLIVARSCKLMEPGWGRYIDASQSGNLTPERVFLLSPAVPAASWIQRDLPSTAQDRYAGCNVVWNGSIFATVNCAGILRTSTDGYNWARRQLGTSIKFLAWAGNRFVGVTDGAGVITHPTGLSPLAAMPPVETTRGPWTYKANEFGEATILRYRGTGGSVPIPASLDGNTVKTLGDGNPVFASPNTSITSVTIPSGVTSIGDDAFSHCKALSRISIPDSVVRIGWTAFYECTSLASVTIGAGLEAIELSAFDGCTKLAKFNVSDSNPFFSTVDGALFNKDKTVLRIVPNGRSGAYTVPSTVTSIWERAFKDCAALTSITIPDTVTSVGDQAMNECVKLASFTLGKNIASIGDAVFDDCPALNGISVSEENPYFISFGGVLFDKQQATLLRVPEGLGGVYVVPDTVTKIDGGAFYGCRKLTSLTLGVQVADFIADFEGCTSLSSFAVPVANSHFSSFGGVLFDKQQSTLVAFPPGRAGFYEVPAGVAEIGSNAFADCARLTGVSLPTDLASIGDYAFANCTSLSRLLFLGHAPARFSYDFLRGTPATIYYLPGTTGWSDSFAGRPAALAPAQTITFTQPAVQVFAPGKKFTLSARASSGLPVSFESGDTNVVTISNNVATIRAAAPSGVSIIARQPGSASYAPAPHVTNTVVINKANQTIKAFVTIGAKTVGAPPFSVTLPSTTSGLLAELSVKSGSAVVSGGNTVTVTGAGMVELAANQSGDGNYNAAPEVRTKFLVSPALGGSPNALSGFAARVGSVSQSQTFVVSGNGLLGDVVVTAPKGFEVSADGTNYVTSLVLPQGAAGHASVQVRLAASVSAGVRSGSVTLVTTGVPTRSIAVKGSVSALALKRMSQVGQPSLPRFAHSQVWTGSRFIVWGGAYWTNYALSQANSYGDGASYDPYLDLWTPMNQAGAPSPRHAHTAVWTGSEMIVWGGVDRNGPNGTWIAYDDGAIYNPTSNSWRPMAQAGTALYGHTAVWTGKEMLVWGSGGMGAQGLAFDPAQGASGAWRSISSDQAPLARAGHDAVWTGETMAIWGGSTDWNSDGSAPGTGAFYYPASESWTSVATIGAPASGDGRDAYDGVRGVRLLWTGLRLLAFSINTWSGASGSWVKGGGAYDPQTGAWERIEATGFPNVRPYMAFWNGSALFAVGSYGSAFSGFTYDSLSRRWTTVVKGTTGSFNGKIGTWAPELREVFVFGGMWTDGVDTYSGGPQNKCGFRIEQ